MLGGGGSWCFFGGMWDFMGKDLWFSSCESSLVELSSSYLIFFFVDESPNIDFEGEVFLGELVLG